LGRKAPVPNSRVTPGIIIIIIGSKAQVTKIVTLSTLLVVFHLLYVVVDKPQCLHPKVSESRYNLF